MPDLPNFDGFQETMDDWPGPSRRRPGLEPIRAFEEATSVTLRVEILGESYESLLRLIRENEWEGEEGIRTVLLSGLGYLDAQLKVDAVNSAANEGDMESARRLDRLANDLAAYHSMYSVMKFKAYKLYKVNQVLEFNVSGLRATEGMWEEWAERMRRQYAEMESEVSRLRSIVSEFSLDWDRDGAGSDAVEHRTVGQGTEPLLPDEAASAPETPQPVQPRSSLWYRLTRLFRDD